MKQERGEKEGEKFRVTGLSSRRASEDRRSSLKGERCRPGLHHSSHATHSAAGHPTASASSRRHLS
ncbi:MAG: hypothetical protein ABEJ69_01770, partial [Candidatus Nanohaloarchaea archaeon]